MKDFEMKGEMQETSVVYENDESVCVSLEKKKRNSMSVAERKKYMFLLGLFAVPFINFAVFWVYLNISAVDFAFRSPAEDGYTLQNFRTMFRLMTTPDSIFWISVKNTVLYWFLTAIVSYMVALIIGYFLYKKVPGHGFYRFMFYLPNLIAPTILVALFKQIIAANGPISLFYEKATDVPKFLADSEIAIYTCLFYSLFFGFGTNLLIISGAMSQIDASIIDAGKIDGANIWQEMLIIVIPVIWPTIVANMISSIAGIFNASGPILLLTNGNYNTMTISFWIYQQTTGSNYYLSAAIGLFFAIIAIPLTMFSRWLLRRVVPSNDSEEA